MAMANHAITSDSMPLGRGAGKGMAARYTPGMWSEIRAPRPLCFALLLLLAACTDTPGGDLSEAERAILQSLSLSSLAAPGPSLSNRVADDPRAAALGHALFFDPSLSRTGEHPCSSCHAPDLYFSDGRARSLGIEELPRNAPTVVGAAYAPWLYWDGRRDSLWSQALAPLEASGEMGRTRLGVVRYVAKSSAHAGAYRALFGDPPDLRGLPDEASPFGSPEERAAWDGIAPERQRAIDRAFANIGKVLGAYQRKLSPAPGPFDRAMDSLARGDAAQQLSRDAWLGARLFANNARTQCLRCHNGPLLTNQSFHRIATGRGDTGPDLGRFLGIQAVMLDPFNCAGPYSDANPADCDELRFVSRRHIEELQGAFKTPTLRGLEHSAPYMHDGRFATLEAVIEHYRSPPPQSEEPHELVPLELSDDEVRQLVAFLRSLGSEIAAEPRWLAAPEPAHGRRAPAD
jgi:cytochrome c peroxidase